MSPGHGLGWSVSSLVAMASTTLVKSRRFRLRGLGSRRFRLRGLGFDDPWKSLGFRVSGEERVERCHAIITNVGLKAKI